MGILFLVVVLLALGLYLGIHTYTFQTWLGNRATGYLRSELNTEVRVEAIELEFFYRAKLQGVTLLDQHNDTLLHGDVLVDIRDFDYKNQKVRLEKILLKNATAKLIKYKGDSTFNYQFMVDYFDTPRTDTVKKQGWEVKFGEVYLEDVAFVYRKEKYVEPPSPNINFDDIWLQHTYGKISEFRLEKDTVYTTVTGLRAKEKSGFVLNDLTTKAIVSEKKLHCEDLHIKTPRTYIKGNLDFSYESWDDYNDFINKVKIKSTLDDSTHVDFRDIAAFAKELNGLNETVHLSGEVNGYVNNFNLKNFKLAFGHHTRFNGNLSMNGLPDIKTSYLHFDAKNLSTSASDIERIPNYPFTEKKPLELPQEIKRLGVISYRGKFDGFVTDFTTYGVFNTGIGKVKSQLSIKLGDKTDDIAYHGKISTENFNLGTMLGQKDFNALTINSEIKGKGLNVKNLTAEFEGAITNLNYNGYNYKDIELQGSFKDQLFSGLLTSKDVNADFDFNGTISFKKNLPQMDFISTINKLNLKELHFTERDSGALSTQIFINIEGDNIDNVSGQINFDNTIYKTRTRNFKLSTFNILMEQSTEDKKIRLNSEYLNATVYGQFSVNNLQPAFQAMLYYYYPAFFKKPASPRKFADQLSFQVKIKKFNTIKQLFLPDLMIATGTVLEGNFNANENKLNLQLNSPRIDYKNMFANELVFILNENNNTVLGEVSGKILSIADSLNLHNFNIAVNSIDKNSTYAIDWDNLKTPSNKGEIKGKVDFTNSQLEILNEKFAVVLNDSVWAQTNPASVVVGNNGGVTIHTLSIANNNQYINVTGSLSSKHGDSLVVNTSNVILRQFNPLLDMVNLKLEGVLDGDIKLTNVEGNFAFNGELHLTNFSINDNLVGELSVNTTYHNSQKYISMQGFTSLGMTDPMGQQIKNISFRGTYNLEKKEEAIDIDFAAKPANLKLLNPFLTDIITIEKGFVNGAGKVHGMPNNILIDGKFRLFNSEIKVDYTNVTYLVTGDIEVMPDQIRFSDLNLREKQYALREGSKAVPQATVNGNIFHTNFSRMQIDYDISYRDMMVLNTSERENKSFYGRLYGTGKVGIYGFLNNLHMDIDNTTTKNSKFFLPLDGPAEIGESEYIHFVKRDTSTIVAEKPLTGLNLYMALHATPDANVQIIVDKTSGDMLNVQGQGELKLTINTLGKFEMFGDYIITDGNYLFTLENVINKKFDIEAGSSISWSGDPLNADIDVTTSYRQRASVAPLLNDISKEGKSRTPVDCKLLITGKLFTPEIRFDIDFPNVDSDSKSKIYSVLSDEQELNRQVFSFLLFRTFLTPQIYNTGSGGVTYEGAAASAGSELLSNRVSEFLNTYFGTVTGIRDLQLGLNYRPANQSSNESVDLALSKQFLDNRITVDGNFGVNNNPTTQTTKGNSNGLIGDVNVDYKLSPDGRFRLKGFNRSNDNTQATLLGAPFTQGIGFFYRVEFETFNELYGKFKKKVKAKEPSQKPNP